MKQKILLIHWLWALKSFNARLLGKTIFNYFNDIYSNVSAICGTKTRKKWQIDVFTTSKLGFRANIWWTEIFIMILKLMIKRRQNKIGTTCAIQRKTKTNFFLRLTVEYLYLHDLTWITWVAWVKSKNLIHWFNWKKIKRAFIDSCFMRYHE